MRCQLWTAVKWGWAWGSASESGVSFQRWSLPGDGGACQHLSFDLHPLCLSVLPALCRWQRPCHQPAPQAWGEVWRTGTAPPVAGENPTGGRRASWASALLVLAALAAFCMLCGCREQWALGYLQIRLTNLTVLGHGERNGTWPHWACGREEQNLCCLLLFLVSWTL